MSIFSKFAFKWSFLSKVNQLVDCKCFRKFPFVFIVVQGRTNTNDIFNKFGSKSSFLSKVNQIVDCKCFRKFPCVFLVFQGPNTNKGTFFENLLLNQVLCQKFSNLLTISASRNPLLFFYIFQDRTKTNEHFSKFASKSSFLSKVNQIVYCKCFRQLPFVFIVVQGRNKNKWAFLEICFQIKLSVKKLTNLFIVSASINPLWFFQFVQGRTQ